MRAPPLDAVVAGSYASSGGKSGILNFTQKNCDKVTQYDCECLFLQKNVYYMKTYLIAILVCFLAVPCYSQVGQKKMGIFEYVQNKKKLIDQADSSLVVREYSKAVNRTPGAYLMRSATFKNASAGCALVSAASFGLTAAFTDEDKKNARTTCFAVGGIGGLASIICYFLSASELNKAGKALELIQTKNGIGLAYKF